MSINRKTLRAERDNLKRLAASLSRATDEATAEAMAALKRAAQAEEELGAVTERVARFSDANRALVDEVQMLRTQIMRIEEWFRNHDAKVPASAHEAWAIREIIAGALNLEPATDISLEAFLRTAPVLRQVSPDAEVPATG